MTGVQTCALPISNALFYLKRAQEAFELLESVRGKHPKNEAIPYNLSCYACQFGDLTLAMDCYQEAAQVGDREKIREVALQDPDMEPIWDQITD